VSYLSASEVMIHEKALYQVYVPLPLPLPSALRIASHDTNIIIIKVIINNGQI